ncbi:unnamed protein product [Paramecium octaurelia]|uniref:aspartate transaminase n=1 Tax=Paramecium octaurelia TaxID=43137 RepID=A0A8S1W563_PAROT|nr:unnamed protein product [Paramecium octaurelia]
MIFHKIIRNIVIIYSKNIIIYILMTKFANKIIIMRKLLIIYVNVNLYQLMQQANQSDSTPQNPFALLTQAPPDPIFGIMNAYKADPSDKKIDLGVGAYRTDEEKPYIFDVVKRVEQEIINDITLNKEYLPIEGLPDFNKGCQRLLFGKDNPLLESGRIVTAQCLGGTGALRVGFDFVKRHLAGDVYVSNPTWSNHNQILDRTGLNQINYPYYDPKTKGFNCTATLDCLSQAKEGSIVLLHVCAHNPTGVDPTEAEWLQIAEVCKTRNLLPFFDCAYQGFASGCIEKDAFAVRKFAELGFQMIVAYSFSKNMGLYNERVGALHIVTSSQEIAAKVLSNLKIVIRTLYSCPPAIGGRIASRILCNEKYYKEWVEELNTVTGRIIRMRTLLKDELDKLNVEGNWDHITKQTGFFTFTGLTPEQCDQLTKEHHVYLLRSGRMSMAGITSKNVAQLAEAIKIVVQNK